MSLLPRLPLLAANRLLEDFLADKDWEFDPNNLPDAFRYAPTGGTRATRAQIVSLHNGIHERAKACGFPQKGTRSDSAKFDSLLSAWLADLEYLHDGEALREDLWAFVAIVVAPDVVRWRFGTTRSRYLGGVRNTFQRLWLRGWALDRGRNSAKRWELLDALSEDAFVQIFERPSLSGHRELARAIAEAWLRASARHGKERMEAITRRATVRIRIQKEIRHLTSLPGDVLAELLDHAFDNAPSVSGIASGRDRDHARPNALTYKRTIPDIEDLLKTNGVAMPDRREFLDLDKLGKQYAVWATLIGEGPVPTRERTTVALSAERLRAQGWANHVRLRADGDLYRAITAQLSSATRAGSNGLFAIPRNAFVRAFKQTSEMGANDWLDCTMRAVAEREQGTLRQEALIRRAFQTAQHRYGIDAVKLGKTIRAKIERAIADCVRRGLLERPRRDRLTLRGSYAEPD